MFLRLEILTTVQVVPAGGPNIQFPSKAELTRSGDGKQIGRTHRLYSNGLSSRKRAKSFVIAVKLDGVN